MRSPLAYRLAVLSLVAACGTNTLPVGNDDGSMNNNDLISASVTDMISLPDLAAPKPDLRKTPPDLYDNADYSGITCGTQSCTNGDSCCIVQQVDGGFSQSCMTSCPDGGITEMCQGPDNCTNGAPICCANLVLGAGTFPMCSLDSAAASCASTCKSDFQPACSVTETFRLCHRGADCADDPDGFNFCCDLQMGKTKFITACVNSFIMNFLNPTCH